MSSLLRSLRRALTPDARRAPDHAARPLIRALFLTCFATLPLGACYTDPNEQIDAMQATIDLQDTLNELGMRTTELQFTLDSLRSIVARQDSTIYRLANLAGIPYPR